MEKIYYSISEVAELLSITQSNLRFWENKFDKLNPKRSAKGTRYYTQADIEIIKQIIFLKKEQKLTLNGAEKKLNTKTDQIAKQQQISERLRKVRAELIEISNTITKITE